MAPRIRKVPHHSTEPLIRATRETGEVLYPDGAILNRPLTPPPATMSYARKVMIAAGVIAALILAWYIYTVVGAPIREEQAFKENLARTVPLELPQIAPLMALDDNAIMATFADQGDTIYPRVQPGATNDGSFELIKLPLDVTLGEAASAYLTGLDEVEPSQLIKIIKGGWVLNVYRNPTSIRVRYADFTSGNLEAALNAAMESQGISLGATTDAGTDDLGNTYREGLYVSGDATYTWRVSAVPLSDVYEVEGLPEYTYYVGIRFTA